MATAEDFRIVESKIEEESDFLNHVSQGIWGRPELRHEEAGAHALLTDSLERRGFQVRRHYCLPTAFTAEFQSREGVTVAVLLEYDALPEIGHACGHNLIAEAGLGAALAAKAAMERDPTIAGKLVVLGTPAEEGGGGKIRLLESGAFDDVDVAMMAHPSPYTMLEPCFLSSVHGWARFHGKETHGAVNPWDGLNAQDAAVLCYQSIALLRQQLRPSYRVNVLISKCGAAVNVISSESSLEFLLRADTAPELARLTARVEECIQGAARATGCRPTWEFKERDSYQNIITNSVLMAAFRGYLEQLDFDIGEVPASLKSAGSTDMGNVSHRVPAIHPVFAIPSGGAMIHTKDFATAAGAPTAQGPTLKMARAMALTALHLMRSPRSVDEAKEQLRMDLVEETRRTCA